MRICCIIYPCILDSDWTSLDIDKLNIIFIYLFYLLVPVDVEEWHSTFHPILYGILYLRELREPVFGEERQNLHMLPIIMTAH